ncbi:hypothetical protein PAXRUDRAFT_171675, partial [Paxillus rubicundulus Ve08.2h10]
GKSASKQEKSVKTKELLFLIKPSNYVKFLKSMLQKHGQEVYEVTEKKHYPFRYTLLKAKGYSFSFFVLVTQGLTTITRQQSAT